MLGLPQIGIWQHTSTIIFHFYFYNLSSTLQILFQLLFDMAEHYRLDASQALKLMQNGSLRVEEYAKSLLARIKERDHLVKAWAYLDPEFVLNQARALDQVPADKRGPLHGMAVGVKDVILTKGSYWYHPISCFHPTLKPSTRYAYAAQFSNLRKQ
jgi:hypothetical protein